MSEKKELFQITKKCDFRVRITTRIQGATKNDFLEDCVRKGLTEAEVSRNIIDIHYSILREVPGLEGMEHIALKQHIISKIKL